MMQINKSTTAIMLTLAPTAAWLIPYVNIAITDELSENTILGSWTAIRAGVEEISFKRHKAQLEFSTTLNQRPFDGGKWNLKGDSLILYGSAGIGRYRVSMTGDTMLLADGNGTQSFVKKDEWRELLIYGPHTATSTLNGEEWFGENVPAYSVRNLGDGNPATCWAEGVPGNGVGEKLYLAVNGRPKTLTIFNGYGKSPALFAKNGRVKNFRATLLAAFNLPGEVTEVATKYHAKKCGPTVKLEVKDIQAKQDIVLPFDWESIEKKAGELAAQFERNFATDIADRSHGCEDKFYRTVILELEIVGVYRGTKFEDTCVSELSIE